MRTLAQRMLAVISSIALLISNAQAQPPSSNEAVQKAVERFLNDQSQILHGLPPGRLVSEKIEFSYNTLLGRAAVPATLTGLSTQSLNLFFRAASDAAFYTFSEEAVRDMVSIASELRRREELSDIQAREVFKALFSVRLIPQAREWHQHYSRLFKDPLPQFIEPFSIASNIPTELIVSGSGELLERRPVDISSGPHVVVAAHPLCHFSQNAIAQIMSDPILSGRLKGHVHFLVPQHRNYDVTLVREWNGQHRDTPMTIVYRASEWAFIDSWDTPTFYFFKNGQLMAKVTGWPASGNMSALYKASGLIGLDAKTETNGAASTEKD